MVEEGGDTDTGTRLTELLNTASLWGQRIPVDFSPGSIFLQLCRMCCTVADSLYGIADQIELQSNIDTATGIYLQRIGAAYNTLILPGQKASWPVRLGVRAAPGSDVAIPVGHRVYATDNQGNLSLVATLVQDSALPIGVGGYIRAKGCRSSNCAIW